MGNRRALLRRILKYSLWATVILVVWYLVLLYRFVTGKPSIRVNYTKLLNQPIEQAPVTDRAWPLYRRALTGFDFSDGSVAEEAREPLDALPGTERWNALTTWLATHRRDLAFMRDGSAKPLLGFIVGAGGDSEDGHLFPNVAMVQKPLEENPPSYTLLLPHLHPLRQAAQALRADARWAREQGDLPRAIIDIHAIMGLARQMRGGSLVGDLVGLGMRSMAVEEIGILVAAHATELSDADLKVLADLIATPDRADGLISFRTETYLYDDIVQRMYTDDGNGNGRLTLEGVRFFRKDLVNFSPRPNPAVPMGLHVMAAPLLSASRRELTERYTRLNELAEANLKVPFRDVDWASYSRPILQMNDSAFSKIRYMPLALLMSSFETSQRTAELYLAMRGGAMTGIALEMHRRRHGDYPKSLAELVPGVLASVPEDVLTGEPLKFRVVDGKPIVYSVGPDRDDDGGRPATPDGSPLKWEEIRWDRSGAAPDCDWVLVPPSLSDK